jgi:hypothetical protein
MTTIELEPSLLQRTQDNPYAAYPYSPKVLGATRQLVDSDYKPFMDASTNPDIASGEFKFAVYLLDSADGAADIARAIEGHVMQQDWDKTFEETQRTSEQVEINSLFILVVDVTNPSNPRPAASLSIADCLYGPSETRKNYTDEFGDEIVPSELNVEDRDKLEGLWDVMAIMAPKEYRKTNASTWAYSALYEASQRHGVNRWISNITDREFSLLNALGIPFEVIPGSPKIEIRRKSSEKPPILAGFHTIDVREIRNSMTNQINALEQLALDNEDWQKVANEARIALNGGFTTRHKAAA